ncbi:unnamed protein product [Prunus armeniaca]|uniref:Uncharacterized protein n=1 Tax=Prunus armeniaca TaxID=36596 RepID=A0A6J5VAK3_PRUAR|nr:unnamed protein product [Prunus armeniaca]
MAWGRRSWGAVGVGANGQGILGLGKMLLGAGYGYGKDLGWGGECDLGNRGLEVGKVAWVWRLTRWCVVELKERKRGEKSGDNWDWRG